MLDKYNPQGEMVIYQTEDGKASVDVMLENETVWLTQKQMALLFDKDQSVIARHIANVFEEGELDKSNMQILHNTMFKYRPTAVYNLDVIIAVGYRVRSQRGTQFRKCEYRELLDRILSANGSPVLDSAGSISAEEARAKAIAEYRKYQVRALTPVEQAYYASLKAIEATTKKK